MEEEKTKNGNGNGNLAKTLKIVIGVLVAVIIGLGAKLYLDTKENKQTQAVLTSDKEELLQKLESLKVEYNELQTNNDSINEALLREQEKIELLLEKVKKTEAGNLSKIRAYEKELGTLRAIMKNYIVQIDSLNTLNQQLVSENIEIKERVQETTRKYEEITQKAEELTTKVQEGSVIKARGMSVSGMTKKDKETDRASKSSHIRTCVTLVENSLAERGNKTVYVRVKGPDGIVLTTNENNLFDVGGDQIIFSAAREIDYQGSEIELCIYYNFGDAKVAKGVYEVTAYLGGKAIGTGQVRLK
jgi:hypothetical protein